MNRLMNRMTPGRRRVNWAPMNRSDSSRPRRLSMAHGRRCRRPIHSASSSAWGESAPIHPHPTPHRGSTEAPPRLHRGSTEGLGWARLGPGRSGVEAGERPRRHLSTGDATTRPKPLPAAGVDGGEGGDWRWGGLKQRPGRYVTAPGFVTIVNQLTLAIAATEIAITHSNEIQSVS